LSTLFDPQMHALSNPSALIGHKLQSYHLLSVIGTGGMGQVYLAEHRRLGRKVALKVLLPALCANPRATERFFVEARAMAMLNHPGVVQVYDCDVDTDGRVYIAMEYLEGETLARRLSRQPMRSEHRLVAAIGAQLAAALSAAHERGIIHRDLKPANIFLLQPESAGGPPVVKILDFGLAKLLDQTGDAAPTGSRSGDIIGTPLYMSPEQCRGTGPIDERADIYALGCILFEMGCGRTPFAAEGVGELIAAHLGWPPLVPAQVEPSLPAPLSRLIHGMLAKSRDERPASAAQVGAALRALLEDRPDSAASVPAVQASSQREPSRPGVKRRWLFMAFVVVALGLGLTVFMGREPASPPSPRHIPVENPAASEPRPPTSAPAVPAPAATPAAPVAVPRAAPPVAAPSKAVRRRPGAQRSADQPLPYQPLPD
jgi:eukaryotic-like serine/threonine-protein kinase